MTALAAIALIRNGRGCVSAGPSDAKVADLSTQYADWPICKFFLTAMVDEALTVASQSSVANYRLCAVRIILPGTARFHDCILRLVSARRLVHRCVRGKTACGS